MEHIAPSLEFLTSLNGLLGDEISSFMNSYKEPPVKGIRLNANKQACVSFAGDINDKQIPWEPAGFYVEDAFIKHNVLAHEAGCFYVQEPSAMAPVAVLSPKKDELVLDLCAAPGSKATQIAAYLNGTGLLVANEPVPERARVLSSNLCRMGVANSIVVSDSPERLALRWPELFDAVLVDAPCSGEGLFRKQPESRLEWTVKTPVGCVKRQKQILTEAIKMLKPGGRLCYSTCTFNTLENDDCCDWLSSTSKRLTALPFLLPGVGFAQYGRIRLWPHRVRGEGQFIALFTKQEGSIGVTRVKRRLPVIDLDKLNIPSWINHSNQPCCRWGDLLVTVPDVPPLEGIRVLRVGLHLAKLSGDVCIPDHAAALAAGIQPDIALTKAEAYRYLAGETLTGTKRGWLTVGFMGAALGWVKGVDGVYKNHYPKHLRRVISDR